GSESDSGSEDTGDTGEPPAPPLYSGDRIHSPLTAHVVAAMQQIRTANPSAADNLFMKVGDSHTVSSGALFCFAGDNVDLDVHAAALQPSLDWFLTGEAAGTTPFDRVTLSAEIGRTASWAISGSPSPLQQELAALGFAGSGGPSVAMVHYGSNDMQMGITYASAMPGFYGNMSDLLDQLIAIGVVPVVFGVTRRLDNAAADRWVLTYTAVARALAQARELPFVDLRLALEPVPGKGIGGDGLHLTGYGSGTCLLTPAGLEYGNNVRNLLALQAFARSRAALIDGEAADLEAPTLVGSGSLADPFQIDALPFADSRDSAAGPGMELDVYDGCGTTADESGPEHLYRLELAQTTAIRALVLDREGVDVDIHLLAGGATTADCLARDDSLLELTLDAGIYYFSLDTYVNGQGIEQSGEYTFVVLECEMGDIDCM
ncbi:MAG: SGNH/GDSL hydrolase family protein, partial [Myxococcales bacterium]|nr:SGNH/GDSL hydrolase family protein [Myxococcales bacterium]